MNLEWTYKFLKKRQRQWLIHTELNRDLYWGRNKIGLHNIMSKFSHFNLTLTSAYTWALDQ